MSDVGKPTGDVRIFMHAAGEGPGTLGIMLGRDHVPHRIVRVFDGEPVPAGLDGIAGLVFLGGPMSVNDPLPWIEPELALIRAALAAEVPVLGLCLGAQLIAKAMGGTVGPNAVPEIGWLPVDRLPGASETWFSGLPARFDAYHWHGETFTLPAGAALLLSSAACAHQGFTLGSALAFQCHLEMTAPMVRDWAASLPPGAPSTVTEQTAAEMCADVDARVAALQGIAEPVFSRWIANVQGRRQS